MEHMQEQASINGGRDVRPPTQVDEAYRALVEHSLQGLIIIQDMRIVFANQAMAEISGYSVEEMLDASADVLRDFVHPQDRERVWQLHQARLDGEPVPDRHAFRALHKDGSTLWLEIHTSRVDYCGRPAIQAACIDVTERHRAELALRRSEARNRALLGAIPDLMFRLSAGGVFLDCKPPHDDSLSVSPSEFIGQHLAEVYPPPVASQLLEAVGRVLATGNAETLEYGLPGRYDEDCNFECRLMACAEREVLAVVRDVTDRRRTERLSSLQRDLAVRLSSLSDLPQALHHCLEAAVTASAMDCGGIYLVEEPGRLVVAAHMGVSEDFVRRNESFEADSHVGRLIMTGKPIYAVYEDLRIPPQYAHPREGIRATGIVPIQDGGRVVACLVVASHAREEVPAWSRTVIESIGAQLGSTISRLRTEAALRSAERDKAMILDSMSELLIYLGPDHRVLWCNRAAATSVGLTSQELVGKRCFELWQDRSVPCENCPVDEMFRTGTAMSAEVTDRTGTTRLLHAEPVRDDAGRLIGAVTTGRDITDRKRAEEELESRVRFGVLITDISTDFVHLRADQIEEGIDRALTNVGRFVGADRSFLFLLDEAGTQVNVTKQWRADPNDRDGLDLRGLSLDQFPWGMEQLRETGVLDLANVRRLQGQAAEAKQLLEYVRIKSVVCVPIAIGGELIGFLGLATVHQERSWSEQTVSLLKMVAEILANALERKRSSEALAERLAFETLLSDLSATFVNLPTAAVDAEIEAGLAQVSDFLQIDRSVIVQLTPQGDAVEVTHSWAAAGLERVPEDFGLAGRFTWAHERIKQGESVVFSDTADAPPEAWGEKEYFTAQGIKSIAVIPLCAGGSTLGAIAFSAMRTHRRWSEEVVQRLRMVGEVFTNALLRKQSERLVREQEQRLQESERKLRTLMGNLPGIAYRCANRAEWPFEFVSEGASALTGYTPDEITAGGAVSYGDLIHPDDRARVWEAVQDALNRGTQFELEYRIRTRDNAEKWVFERGRSVPSAGGVDASLEGFITDVTERKRAEMALRESESRFRELAKLLPQTVFEMDAEGRFTYANRAAAETFGYTEQEAVGMHVLQVIAPHDHERVIANMRRRLAGESFSDHEYTSLARDGRTFPVLLYSSPIVRDGRPVGLRGIVFDVTEQKRAEQRLRELRDIIDRSPVLVFLWRVEPGRWPVEFASENVVDSLGYSADDFTSGRASWPGVTHPDDVPRLEAEVARYLAEGRRKWSQEYRLITRSGDVRWFTDENLALVDENGRVTHIQSILLDTTERKQMEDALFESERKYRELYEGSRDGTATTDLDGRVLQCNSVFSEMLGYSSEELKGMSVWDLTPARWKEREKRIVHRQVHARGYSDVFEKEYIRKDGSVFPVELRVYLTRDAGGKPVGTWAIVRDIAERKQAEMALRASEKNYREIFNAANEAVFIHDPETGRILDVNETMLRMYGLSYEEALAADVADVSAGETPYSQADARAWIRKAAEGGPQVFEWLGVRRNGEPFWEEVHLKSIVIGGEPRVLAAVRDITDRKKAETESQQHLAELTRAWHANTLGELASGLAHELNQPLCAILNYSGGCLRLSRREHLPMETLRTSIEQIAAQAERAADIIKRIRSLIAKREPHRSDLDLKAILDDAARMLRMEANRHSVAVRWQLAPNLPRIKGDGVEIEQVVLNLMRNAIEAMSDPAVTRRILTISTRLRPDREIEITVTDTGRGLSRDLAEKVFDSFFTTKAQGLGVGLALSRRIVEAHGGRLWVESDGRSGATFGFTLPVEGTAHGEGNPRSFRSG